ncbi:MAG: alpha/beta hydrolase [Pirellula sp.]|nr:alpha/beta hydrolase [Pirellula sp.]
MRYIIVFCMLSAVAHGQEKFSDLRYGDADELQKLDVYSPPNPHDLPVAFWIHGGGWETGDKTQVDAKPKYFADQGYVLVSVNYRLRPQVEMETIFQDVAKALGWTHKNIAQYGGDPNRIIVMGHSAGAQLAAMICVDQRYAKAEGVPMESIRGCVPVDGDTYDLPAIIQTTELRQALHRLPQPTKGHRVKFGNDPQKHVDLSVVTHIEPNKGIPPFLILHVAGHPDVTAQAQRLAALLQESDVPVTVISAKDTNHNQLNARLGNLDDSNTKELSTVLSRWVE